MRLVETERQFQAGVVAFAQLHGWRCYHTWDSRRSDPGFPDLLLVRNGVVVIAELKAQGGRCTPAQVEWLEAFDAARSKLVRVWRPGDWPDIEAVLGAP
jgi:hypothetical protein